MPLSNTRVCRITGLKSAKGLKLNGSAGRVSMDTSNTQDDRLLVLIDGQPDGPVALKRSNLDILPSGAFDAGVGVGRGTLRDTTFNATVVDNYFMQIVTKFQVSGRAARSRGSLMAIEEFLKIRKKQGKKGPLLIMPTDLNVARAVNRLAAGDLDVALDGPLNKVLQSVAKLVQGETKGGNMVLIKFYPHRVLPDGFQSNESLGAGRFGSVLAGAFKIYPCAYEPYHDSMEVRYVDATSPEEVIVKHEIYLDYGVEETESYARHAVALGEYDRLSPLVLAQVDPQAFWAAVLHIEAFLKVLKACELHDLVAEWDEVAKGVRESRHYWKDAVTQLSLSLSSNVAAGIGNDWGIRTAKDHKNVSNDCAVAAIVMMVKCLGESADESRSLKTENGEGLEVKFVTIENLDYYKGTELDRLFFSFSRAGQLESIQVRGGKNFEQKHRYRYLYEALEEGFGSIDISADPLDRCDHCGNLDKKKLKSCGGCNGVAYCSRECQAAEWKKGRHKADCNRTVALVHKLMRHLHAEETNMGG